MENPFESGHIKNYVLLYASVVVIMVLFFIASTLFHDVKKVQKKVFDANVTHKSEQHATPKNEHNTTKKFKLLQHAY